MKNMILFIVLFACLIEINYPQSETKKITGQLEKILNQISSKQIPDIYSGKKKDSYLSSSIYKPSVVTTDDSLKYSNTYDNSGNLITSVGMDLINGIWTNSWRETYVYDNLNHVLTELEESWINNTWTNYTRFTSTYDNFGHKLSYYYARFINGVWQDLYRHTYSYDNSGNMLTDVYETWPINAWVNEYKTTSTYDNAGNQLSFIYEEWSGNGWTNSFRYISTYNSFNKPLLFLEEVWQNNKWAGRLRGTYSYNNLGYTSQILVESNDSTDVWMNEERISYTYNNAGEMTTGLVEIWTNNKWENYNNEIYSYDSSENLLTYVTQNLDNGTWINFDKKTYSYDNNNNCIIGEYFKWENGFWTLQPGGYLELSYNNKQNTISDYASVIKVEYITVTGITDDIQDLKYSLEQNFPNPFNPVTTIKYSIAKEDHVNLTVYDISGSKVAELVNEYKPSGNYSVQFSAGRLASGIYFYKLKSGNYSMSKKFILLK